MHCLQQIIVRLRPIIHRLGFEAELEDEIRFHIDIQTEPLIKSGMPPDAPRTEAMRGFGGVEQFKEGTRDFRGVVLMETIWQDIRYGFRMLGRSPAFTGPRNTRRQRQPFENTERKLPTELQSRSVFKATSSWSLRCPESCRYD